MRGCQVKWSAVIMLFALGSARAQQIVTDRPDQTESAAIVPLGLVQWEGGILVEWEDADAETRWMTPTSLVRLPIHEKLELRWVYNQNRVRNEQSTLGASSTTDMELGVKWNVLDGTTNGHMLAVLSHWALPTGGESGGGSSHKLCLSHDVGEAWALGYNVGCLWDNGMDGWAYALAVGRAIGGGWSIYAEPYGTWTNEAGHRAAMDAGFTWLQNDRIQWDWSMAIGLNHDFGYQSIGLSWLLGD